MRDSTNKSYRKRYSYMGTKMSTGGKRIQPSKKTELIPIHITVMAPRPARKLPAKIAKRWKVYREKEGKEDAHFEKVEENKTKPRPMLNDPVGRREKAEAKNNAKRVKPKKPDNHW